MRRDRGGLVLPDIKAFETSVNNTVLYWYMNREASEMEAIEWRTYIYIYANLVNDKEAISNHKGKDECFIYLFIYKFIYLFIFGCVGSSFLCKGFL